jgi:hypothetical protein
VFAVAAATVAGWLLLFVVLLILPPASQPSPDENAPPSAEPPAVVSLLAGRLDRDGFRVTLADLAARGWFRLSGTPGPASPVMCVVPAETPAEPLAPYERRVMAHVAVRAGARGEVPAPALSDGFEGGEPAFMKAFREEVTADAVQRGLTRPRLSGGRIGLLWLVLLVPAGALALALAGTHQHYPLAFGGGSWFGLGLVATGVGVTRRPSAAGRAVLDRWHAAADAARRSAVAGARAGAGADTGADTGAGTGGGGAPGRAADGGARLQAYAAALGRAPGVTAVFAAAEKNVVWSSYRGSWQRLPIESNAWPWPRAIAFMLAIIFGPIAFFGGVIYLFVANLGWLAVRVIGLAVSAALVGVAVLAARKLAPRFAEFDGQVIRQTFTENDEGPDEYRVVVDDGVRATAWDLQVPGGAWRLLKPGTFVRARVNLYNREVSIHPVEPPAVPRPLAEVAAEQERALTGGLPDPGVLVTADEAGAVVGRQARGKHVASPVGRAMIWQPAAAARPILRIEVRTADGQPEEMPYTRPVPGVADGYLAGQSAVLYAARCTVTVSIHGAEPAEDGPGGEEAALIRLLSLVAGRLPGLVTRP